MQPSNLTFPNGGRRQGRRPSGGGTRPPPRGKLFAPSFQRNAEQLEAVSNQREAQLARHPLLQALNFLVAELDDLAALDIDQMIVVLAGGFLVAAPARTKVMPLKDALGGKQLERTVHS